MHLFAFNKCGFSIALVGHAFKQRVHLPQDRLRGVSYANGISIIISPRKKYEPRLGIISSVFLPIKPNPAFAAQ